jgi:hypothetical protein
MLKKSLIFGSVALFIAALITLTGCPTSVDDDDDSSGTRYAHRIYGWNVDPYQAQRAIDNAVAAGQPIVLEDELFILPGELNFKNAEVRINGRVIFNGGVMNMTDAQVSWAPGAKLTMENDGYYIHRQGTDFGGKNFEDWVTPAASVWFAERLEDIRPTATRAAVRNFTLGPKAIHDYSRDSNGISARVSAQGLGILYVLEKLTIPSDAAYPDVVSIAALGDLDVTGTIINNNVRIDLPNLPLLSCSTLTSSRGATVMVEPYNGEILIPNVRAEAGGITITQNGGPDRITIRGKLTGPGTVAVSGSDITVYGGNGNLNISGTILTRWFKIYSTGKVTLNSSTPNSTLTIRDDSIIMSDVAFGANIANVAINAPLELNGNVTLINGQALRMSNENSVTLGTGKTITTQITPARTTQIIPAPLLTAAGGPVVLTPYVNNNSVPITLTTGAAPADKPESIALAKSITLAGGTSNTDALVIENGTLQVEPQAIFAIAQNLGTGISDPDFGYLTVADGGTLDVAAVTGVVFIGSEGIGDSATGGGFKFTASGGAVTLGNHQITGSAPGTKLAPAKGSGGTIGVGGGTLIFKKVELDLATAGTITLATAGSKVELDDGAKITLVAGANGQATKFSTIRANSLDARLTGAFEGLANPEDIAKTTQAAWSVAHKGGNLAAVNIIADDANVVLGKSPKASFVQ